MINIEPLLEEITPEAPSGDRELVYDPAFLELEKGLIDEPEEKNKDGKVIKKALRPNWKEVSEAAIELLLQTHDLRVAVYLTRALLRGDGLEGFGQGLQVIYGYLEQYWETFYPQLASEDDNDPTERMNIIADLNDYKTIIGPIVNMVPLVNSPVLGSISLAQVREALKISGTQSEEMNIDAVCTESGLENLQNIQAVVTSSLQWLNKCIALLNEKVGQVNVPTFDDLLLVLTEIEQFLKKQLARLQPDEVGMVEGLAVENSVADGDSTGTGGGQIKGIAGRPDVLRALDDICKYYETCEPGSPVPLLLQRARGLVEKNFVEIIDDLVPDSLSQFKKILVTIQNE